LRHAAHRQASSSLYTIQLYSSTQCLADIERTTHTQTFIQGTTK
jgi:hypothetical protein